MSFIKAIYFQDVHFYFVQNSRYFHADLDFASIIQFKLNNLTHSKIGHRYFIKSGKPFSSLVFKHLDWKICSGIEYLSV